MGSDDVIPTEGVLPAPGQMPAQVGPCGAYEGPPFAVLIRSRSLPQDVDPGMVASVGRHPRMLRLVSPLVVEGTEVASVSMECGIGDAFDRIDGRVDAGWEKRHSLFLPLNFMPLELLSE
jgi:hypothetical protein